MSRWMLVRSMLKEAAWKRKGQLAAREMIGRWWCPRTSSEPAGEVEVAAIAVAAQRAL
jgi:hypothetical protein